MNKVFLLSFISLFSFFTINAQEVYWPLSVQEINTGSNSTYFLQSANIDGASVTSGYILGAFFENDEGDLQCGGFVNCGSEDMGIAVMGDDTTTDEKDGFYEGEEITWLAYGSLLAQTYTASVLFSTSPPFGSNSYSTNGINIVSQFNISSDVLGCMSDTACNFNANATEEDSSCTYADENYNCDGTCIDTDGDTVCDIYEIEGCMDATACNYNELATNEDNSCTDPETNLNCDGNCLNDTDNDGICDENEIEGCTNNIACNYDATATDLDESCTFTSGCESCDSGTIIDNDLDDDGVCNDEEIVGCTDNTACNYNPLATDDNGNCTYTTGCQSCEEGAIIDNDVDNDGVCNDDEQEACLDTQACNYNSNPTFDSDSTLCIYVTAACDVCSGAEDGNGTIIDNDADNDGICNANEIEGCSDMTACNYDAIATDLDESCIYTAGCESCEEGIIIDNDDDEDSVCNEDEVPGCTDTLACNYNTLATDDVESCVYATGECDVCSGETNGTGSLIDNDADNDGICNADEQEACLDTQACNYNSNPTFDSNSTLCIYATASCDVCSGAEDGTGTIIDNDADNDGLCDTQDIISGCTDEAACNYNSSSTVNSDNDLCTYTTVACESCSGVQDGTGTIIDNDLDDDGVCDLDEVVGCQSPEACNYLESATDASACVFANAICSVCEDGNSVIYDADNDGLCDAQDIISGCTDETACNYNSSSTVNSDNDICIYITVACETCSGAQDGTGTLLLNDTDLDGVCDDLEVFGCTDSLYIEYSALATELDESCVTLIIEGCTDSLAFNFSIMANTSIESCLFNIEVDFSTTSTNTTTIFGINPDNISLVLGDSLITEGDIIGGFYIIEGQLYCAGFTAWTVSDFDFSLWMDDPATIEIDGVTDDATIYWIVQQNETMLNYLVDFTTIQVSGDYTIVNQITLNENTIIGCMDTTAFNYNSEAFIGDGACVEVIFGCLDTEACNYNEEANTEDNSLCDSITALIPDFQNGQPLTVVTDANNPTYVWLLDEDVQSETSNEYTPYVNGIYTVVVTEDSGCTATASYILDNIGLDEYTVNQLNIHPNPAHNYIEINSTQSKIESLKLYSITGQLLQEYTVGAFQFKIERNSLPNGIYFIQAIVNGNEVTKRVLFK